MYWSLPAPPGDPCHHLPTSSSSWSCRSSPLQFQYSLYDASACLVASFPRRFSFLFPSSVPQNGLTEANLCTADVLISRREGGCPFTSPLLPSSVDLPSLDTPSAQTPSVAGIVCGKGPNSLCRKHRLPVVGTGFAGEHYISLIRGSG